MKHERLIHTWKITDVEIHLDMVRVLFRAQKADVSDISEVSLWYITTTPVFWPEASRRMLWNIRYISSKSILLISIIVHRVNTRV